MASPAEKRWVYRRAHRKFQVMLKLFLELALNEACLFVGFFKGNTSGTLKRIEKTHFTEGFSIKRYFGLQPSLWRSPVEIVIIIIFWSCRTSCGILVS